MATKSKKWNIKKHPINLSKISIIKLSIEIFNLDKSKNLKDIKFNISTGHTDFNVESKKISVGLKVEIGLDKEEKLPLAVAVEVSGLFRVNDDEFPLEKIDVWAKENAPLILWPYIREQIYSLSIRCGISPIVLPTLVVPTLSIK